MFKPTQEEIDKAINGGRPIFKEREEVTFTVTEVEEKTADDGSINYLVKTIINDTDNAGKKYTVWCRSSTQGGRGQLMGMLKCWMSFEKIGEGVNPAMVLVGKTMKCAPKFHNGYANWYDWKAVDTTPNIGGVSVTQQDVSDIPF